MEANLSIRQMLNRAIKDVALYEDILSELDRVSDIHPNVHRDFIVKAILKKLSLTEEWFKEIQDHHIQSINDCIKTNTPTKPRRKK